MFYILLSVLIVYGYLIGSIPNGVLIGKIFFDKDPRKYASGNIGATNSSRIMGKKVGYFIGFLDAFKTLFTLFSSFFIVKLITKLSGSPIQNEAIIYYSSMVASCFGHCFSVFIHFNGGKSAACFLSSCCGTSYILLLVAASYPLFLKKTRYASVSIFIVCGLATIFSWIMFIMFKVNPDLKDVFLWGWGRLFSLGTIGIEFPLSLTIESLLVVFQHRKNISNLINHSERKI